MIPSGSTILTTNLNVVTQPSKQHRMFFDRNRISGICDGLEAVTQAVYKILNIERYTYLIYSWNYGIELMDLFGKAPAFVCPELERRVKEALLQDDRITGVDNFDFDTSKKGVIAATFTVHTIFGDLNERMAVNV